MPRHTPGPWRYEPATQTIRSEPANYWLATIDSWDGAVKPHNHANAKLMAAAPELLEALQALIGNGSLRAYVPNADFDAAVAVVAKATKP